jgi:hypothetical protein
MPPSETSFSMRIASNHDVDTADPFINNNKTVRHWGSNRRYIRYGARKLFHKASLPPVVSQQHSSVCQSTIKKSDRSLERVPHQDGRSCCVQNILLELGRLQWEYRTSAFFWKRHCRSVVKGFSIILKEDQIRQLSSILVVDTCVRPPFRTILQP